MSIASMIISLLASRAAKRFEKYAHNPVQVQQDLLLDIIRANANTEYGRRYDFASIKTIADYQAKVPLVAYENIRDEIDRISAGEKNVLTAEAPVMFAMTSGTTGKPKLIPMTPTGMGQPQQDIMRTWLHHARLAHRDIFKGQVISLVSPAVEGYTENQIPYGAASGHIYRSMPTIIKTIYGIPYEVFEIEDYEAKYYALMRIAMEQDVRMVVTANPSSVLKLCEKADEHGDSLIEDIRRGTLSQQFDIPPATRTIIENNLKPNPKLAARLEQAREKRGGKLRAADYWPKLSLIGCWKGGTVGHYIDKFSEWTDPDGSRPVAVRDLGLIASEAHFSVPMNDEDSMGVLTVGVNFYEFVTVDEVMSNPNNPEKWQFLTIDQVKQGEQYYIFFTTRGGLYRYDINDVIEVAGFYHKTPMIRFLRKGRGMTNITGEKLSVNQVINAVQQASEATGVLASHFKAEADQDNSRYLLRVEPLGSPTDDELRKFLAAFERSLVAINIEYKSKRESLRLGNPVLHRMREGWYERQRKAEVAGGKRAFQAKTELLSASKAQTVVVRPELEGVIELE